MYDTFVLVDRDSKITADDIHGQIASLLERPGTSRAHLVREGEGLSVRWQGFTLDVKRNADASVLAESQEIAGKYAASRAQRQRIAMSAVRIEMAGSEDPGMDYFNDFCLVLEAIEKLGTVYTFDVASGEFTNI